MNERYHKLANEAWCSVNQRIGFNDAQRRELFEREFAELIVKECAKIADDPDVDMLRVGKAIKEHFGVEVFESNENTFGYIIDPGPASSKEIQDARNDCLDGTL